MIRSAMSRASLRSQASRAGGVRENARQCARIRRRSGSVLRATALCQPEERDDSGLARISAVRWVVRGGALVAGFKTLARLVKSWLTKSRSRLGPRLKRVFFVQHLGENSRRSLLEAAFFIACTGACVKLFRSDRGGHPRVALFGFGTIRRRRMAAKGWGRAG